jgi:hypothetical protein
MSGLNDKLSVRYKALFSLLASIEKKILYQLIN